MDAKTNMIKALSDFRKAYNELVRSMDELEDVNDFICDGYPFSRSFDELGVENWCENTIENLNK